ncbi:MAG TPA: hypothetical protein VER96_31720 [Polyangiaceae bacterium]|nr:hypothetical protein [Polyangiaceae bacterium]
MSNHPQVLRRLRGGPTVVRALFIAGLSATSACSSSAPSDELSDTNLAHTSINVKGFGPSDVGSGPKEPAKTASVSCPAQFTPTISNGEIKKLTATAATTGCAQTFCKTTALSNGGTGYTPVSGNNLSADFPIPKGAITSGCPAVPSAPVCPTKMSNGKPASGCGATAADSACETITLCPDPGGFEDASDSATVRKLQAPSLSDIAGLIPSGITQSVPGTINSAFSKLGPMYVNPCEWDSVLDGLSQTFDIAGNNKGGQFASCTADSECASNRCSKSTQPHIFFGQCTSPPASPAFEIEEGGSAFGIKVRGGLNDGRAQIQRALFYPSTSFTATSYATLRATAKIFGIKVELMRNDLKSKLSECGYDFSWESFSDGDDFSSLGALVLDAIEKVGATVEASTGRTSSSTPAAKQTACQNALASLRSAEKSANEKFHDALIATTFFNLTGGGGRVVTNRAAAQGFIDTYKTAVSNYRTALSTFNTAQQQALDHSLDAKLFDFQVGLSLPFVKTYGIGPFSVGVEMGVFGRIGLQDVRLTNKANTHFTNTTATPCTGIECMRLQATTSMMPHLATGAYAYVGAGFDLGLVGGSIKVRGELDLINVKMPIAGSMAIDRTRRDINSVISKLDLPKQAKALVDAGVVNDLTPAAFELVPDVAQFNAPVLLAGSLSPLEGIAPNSSFLSGRVELIAEAKLFLVGKKRWKKTLFDWKGFDRVWDISTPKAVPSFLQDDVTDAVSQRILTALRNRFPIVGNLDFVPLPNMALLPKLALLPVTGTADPTSAASTVQTMLDTKKVPTTLDKYFSHLEGDIGKPWTDRAGGGRCSFLPVIH